MLLQIFKMKLGIPFLQLFLSSIMFTTVTPCIQGEHQFTENKTYRELSYRLSKDVVPRLYNISIIFFPTMTHFDAKCKIDIEILKTISNISLHSHDTIKLEKEEIKLIMQNKVYELSEPPYYRRDENIVDLYFDQVPPGNYTLSIVYVKNIRESDMEDEGYFKTIFLPETDNQQKLLLVTTIQTIEARKWFPCWGEPEFKATFVISFNHEIKYYIWPTMQSERYTLDEYKQDWMWISFVISYPISTYHVMFILTDLDLKSHKEYISHPSIERYKVDVFRSMWSRLSVANFTQFSEVVIDKILQSEWYHKIHVSITSIDQLAIPTMQEDVFGKWRLIVYKYSILFFI
ncbi:leucyl-cystinyl aminopeptidase [Ooceraea biroi]|uniref:leucyl-cystinyl aminopeptidase n=1 Tax=Ooceraea biroi TaxID=2015173 RepID=UPI0009716BA8|nr:leucyl-cystinyl aminopeptidase [Ooceraea biroi]